MLRYSLCLTVLAASLGLCDPAKANHDLMFVNYCQSSGSALVCTPVTLSMVGGGHFAIASKLPEVIQPIDPTVTSPEIFRMHGATVDARRGLVFWQAACASRFFTTDVRTSETKEFSLNLAALGISGAQGGICLNEWVFDEKSDSAIALGGAPVATGHGRVQFAFALKADGNVSLLHDLRASVDADQVFGHPFQSIVSFDPLRREILTGPTFTIGDQNPQNQIRLRVALDDGRVERVNGGFGIQAELFDFAIGRNMIWSCTLPGVSDETSFSIKLTADDLSANNLQSTTDLCYQGFLGAGYNRGTEQFLILSRKSEITEISQTLSIDVIDIEDRRFSGWIPTNADYGVFKVTTDSGANMGPIPGKTFFFSVMFVPCAGKDGCAKDFAAH